MLHTSHKVCLRDKQTVITDSKFEPPEFNFVPYNFTFAYDLWQHGMNFLCYIKPSSVSKFTIDMPIKGPTVPTCHTRCSPG